MPVIRDTLSESQWLENKLQKQILYLFTQRGKQMTLAELMEKSKTLMTEENANNEEVIKTLEADYAATLEERTLGLKTNRDTILGEKKKAVDDLHDITEKYSYFDTNAINPEDYQKMKEDYELLKLSAKDTPPDIKEQQKEWQERGKTIGEANFKPKLEESNAKLALATKEVVDLKSKYLKTRKENLLNEALREVGAVPDLYWKQGFFDTAKMDYDEINDNVSIEVKHPTTGMLMPLDDWKVQLPETPEGKRIIPARLDLGGGGNGGGGNGNNGRIADFGEYLNNQFDQ